jgi:hypothetical protein
VDELPVGREDPPDRVAFGDLDRVAVHARHRPEQRGPLDVAARDPEQDRGLLLRAGDVVDLGTDLVAPHPRPALPDVSAIGERPVASEHRRPARLPVLLRDPDEGLAHSPGPVGVDRVVVRLSALELPGLQHERFTGERALAVADVLHTEVRDPRRRQHRHRR